MSVKKKTQETIDTTKTVAANFNEFVQAVSLTVVSTYTILTSYLNSDESYLYYALFAAGVVQVLIAFTLLVKHFSKKD